MKLRTVIALAVIFALSVTGTALVLAETVTEDIAPIEIEEVKVEAEIEVVEEPENKPEKIERSESWTDEFSYLLDDRLDTEGDGAYYYRSIKDIIADKGENLYYPTYAPYTNAEFAFVIHSQRGSIDEIEGPIAFQIEYAVENLEIFWIVVDNTHLNSAYNPVLETYESHGTVFYISEYREEGPNGYGGHFVEGILEGSNYSFFATDVEEAKLIIDSLEKAE